MQPPRRKKRITKPRPISRPRRRRPTRTNRRDMRSLSRSGRWTQWTASSALAVLATAAPTLAAGPTGPTSTTPTTPGQTTGAHASPPSSTRLPHDGLGTGGTTPFAWVDDATVLRPGATAVTVSAISWHGTDASELEAPVVGAAVGAVPRLQLSVRAPYVVSDAATAITGGWGTTYLSAKVGLLQGDNLKLSVAPTLQVVSPDALASLTGKGREQ